MAGKQTTQAFTASRRRTGAHAALLVLGAWLVAVLFAAVGTSPAKAQELRASAASAGYLLADTAGVITAFGDATARGGLDGATLGAPIVDGDMTPTGAGYVLVGADGGVFSFGDAPNVGSMGGTPLNSPIVGIDITPTGKGYILVAADGGVFSFGDAPFKGSMGGIRLNAPIVDIGLIPSNDGYRLSASDGGVFAFGNASFNGSMGGRPLNKPVTGLIGQKDGPGYALVAADGGFFAFGGFVFRGSLGSITLGASIVDAVPSPTGLGYNLVGSDGGVFAFGDAPYSGSLGGRTLPRPIVTILGLTNETPDAKDDSFNATEDTALVVGTPGVLSNDTDGDGDTLTVSLVTGPAKGTLALNGNGSFTYTPTAQYNGADSFTYKVSDGYGGTDTATATIAVAAVNDIPVAADDAYSTNEDIPLVVAAPGVLANDTDVETASPTAVLVTGPTKGTLTLNSDGSFTYTPNVNTNGADSFTYKANDGTADSNVATVSLTVNALNDAPVAVGDVYVATEDTNLVVSAPGVLGNDADVEGSPLTALLVANPGKGTVTLNADGSFTYTPNANANGADSFTYKANDGTADSNVATVSLTVNPVNDDPVADDDSYSTNEDTALNQTAPGVLDGDTDVDGNTLSATVLDDVDHGTLTLNADGSFLYTPAINYNGPDAFTYTVSDGNGGSDVGAVTLTVNAVNDAPVAVNDAHNTAEDTPLTVAAPGVLSNDTDVESSPLTAVLATGPANGTLTLNADGSFTYTPSLNHTGLDSFSYKANDGTADGNVATVTITVGAANDAPVADDDSYSTNEDTALNQAAPGVLDGDIDVDGDTLTATVLDDVDHGTLSLNTNGSFLYTPTLNYNGPDAFTYTVSDGNGGTDVGAVTLTVNAVNDAPVADDDSYATNEDTALSIPAPGVLDGDSDVDGDALSATVLDNVDHGTLTLNPDGSFLYTPTANYNGADSFTYTVSDGKGGSDVGAVTLTVNAVNDAPAAGNNTFLTNEDTPFTVTAPGVLANDTDTEGNPLTAVKLSDPTLGVLAFNSNGSFTYTPNANAHGVDSFTYKANDGAADSNVATVFVTIDPVNDRPTAVDDGPFQTTTNTNLVLPARGVLANDTDADGQALTAGNASDPANGTVTLNPDGSFSYTPDNNFNGTDTFTYDVSDGALTDTGTVTINTAPPNATPTADATSKSGNEDGGAITVTLTGHDADGDALTFAPGTATNGLVTVPSGTSCDANVPSICTATVTYTPGADFNGGDSFTYTVNDGTIDSAPATATITVNPVNDAPSFTKGGHQTVNEDAGAQTVNGWATAIAAGPADESSQTVVFAVTNDNNALFATAPAVSSGGALTYTPAANANGSATVSVRALDNGGTDNGGVDQSATQTFTITITAVNDVPSFTKGADQTVLEDAGAQSVSNWATAISKGPADESAQSLSFTTSNDNNALFSVQPGVSPTGTLVFTGAPNAVGSATVTISLSDTGGTANGGDDTSDAQTFTVTVGPVNDEPSFTKGADDTVLEDSGARTVAGWSPARSAGPADESAQVVTVERVSTTNDALFSVLPTVDAGGTLAYTPAADANGSATVTLRATDDGGTANGGDSIGPDVTFVINVTPVNDAPSFTKGGEQTLAEDAGAQSVSNWATALSKGPANESAQALTFEVTGNDNAGLFSSAPAVSPTGTLTFTSAPNKHGVANVTLRVKDDGGTANGGVDASATQSFVITVNAVNDAPVAAAKSFTVQANMKRSLDGLLAGATDPADVAGDAAWTPSFTLGSITAGAGCVGCTVSNVNNANGTFDFDPPAGGTGTYTLTYTVVDNGTPGPGATSAPETITLTVNGPVIWFVNTTASAGGTGRLSAPFNNLPAATTAMGTDTNERIFVTGGNVTGNVTLPTNGWLISEAATGSSFDDVMGFTPPSNTIARPAVNGTQRTLTGTVTLGTNSVVRGFDLTPTSGGAGLVASGKTGLVVNQLSVTTINARAVNLSTSSGTFNLKKVQSTGADRGISLVSVNTGTGAFTVTGDGTTPASGGVITTSTAVGSAGSPEAGIYLNDTKNVSLAWMTVSSGAANGIYGANVTTLTLADSTVSNNGTNETLDHSGIHFANLLGTSSMTRVTVFGSREDNAKVLNTSGTATLTVSDSVFRDNHVSVGANGLYVDASGSAGMTFTSTNNTIQRNHTSGLAIFGQSSVRMNVTVTGGTYVTDNGVGLDIETNGTGGMAFNVNGGTVTGCATCAVPVNVYKGTGATGTGTNATAGTINGMTIANGMSTNAPGIWVHGEGAGALRIAVTNNNISQIGQYGILVSMGNGSSVTDATISGNTIVLPADPGGTLGVLQGIQVDSGTLSTDTTSVCADIKTNNVTNPTMTDIRVRNRQVGTTFRLPGYTGGPTDTGAVATYLQTRNTIGDAAATISSSPGFTGNNPIICNAP